MYLIEVTFKDGRKEVTKVRFSDYLEKLDQVAAYGGATMKILEVI